MNTAFLPETCNYISINEYIATFTLIAMQLLVVDNFFAFLVKILKQLHHKYPV